MANTPLMPKATAVWLVDNTALSFTQIASFCKLHPLEVKAIADGEAALFVKEDDKPQPLSEEYMSASGFSWFRALLERFKGIFGKCFPLAS